MNISPGFVGIDVSKSSLDVFDAAIGRSERIDNASAPIAALAERWRSHDVFVVFEATGAYDRILQKALTAAGVRFARVNPLRARDFARAAGFLAKTDAVDARMLAAMGERLRPRASQSADADRERLRQLHRRRDQLVLMRKQERTRVCEAEHPQERQSIEHHIAWLSAEIRAIERSIRTLIAQVQTLKQAWNRLCSAPGVGFVTATALLALLPELGTRSAKTIAALAGVAPLNRDSGKERGKRSIAGGRRRVRTAVYMGALAAKRSPHFAALYRRLRAAGKSKKVALIAIARKLLVTLNAMMRDGTVFKPA